MTKIEDNKIRWFIRKLHSEYERQTLLRDWCDIQVYFEEDLRQDPFPVIDELDETEDQDFVQIGQWTQFPVDIINSSPKNEHIISDLVRRITLGERNFLINQLDDLEQIRYVSDLKTIEDLQEVSKQVQGGDKLFLPLNDKTKKLRKDWWKSDDHYHRKEEFLLANSRKINIHWYPPDKDPNLKGYGYLINSDEISLIQKWHGDSTEPEFDYDEEYSDLSRNRPFMAYFGEEITIDEDEDTERFQEKVDFLYRTVFSKPDINPNDVLQFRI
jgi:hypothetical protein